MTEELDVLGIVAERLDAAGIPYMLTGSMAANYYAVPRMTRDIDVVVEMSVGDAERVCALFEPDFYVDRDAARDAIAGRGTFNLIHTALVVKVDFLVRKDTEYRREEFRRRRRMTVEGLHLFVVAPEDLIISKLEWARDTRSEVQLGDVRNLLACAELDRAYPDAVGGPPRPGHTLPGGWRMTDTSPAIDRRYRELLLQRSGVDRVKMGGSMFATARALVVASIRAREPAVSAAQLRQALFLRFYGGDFPPAERQRIAAWLGREDAASRAPTRKVPVNWDDLGMALTADPAAWSYYLDRRSGEVQMVPVDRLDDEGTWPSADEIDAGLDAGHLIPIEPLGSSVEYGWMAEFAASVADARLRDRLEVALAGRGAFRRFKNALLDALDERPRWFAFRDARLREAAREWLAEQGIEPAASPPREPS